MKKAILVLLFLGFSQTSVAMQPTAAKAAGQLLKHYGKKAFSGTMTGLHWTIAAGASINEGYKKLKSLHDETKALEEDKCTDAPEDVSNFISSALEKTHNVHINGVKVNPGMIYPHAPEFPMIGVPRKHVVINQAAAQEIDEAQKNNDQEKLNKWLGIIGHEVTHIQNEDVPWRAAADLILPFVTHGSVKVARGILPIAKKTRTFLGEQLVKIPTALGKGFITDLTRISFYQYQEQRADDNIPNDVNKLIGMKTYLYDADICRTNTLKKTLPFLDDETLKNLDPIINMAEEHPLPKKRIQKLDQRIALLEKDQKDKSYNS